MTNVSNFLISIERMKMFKVIVCLSFLLACFQVYNMYVNFSPATVLNLVISISCFFYCLTLCVLSND